MAAIIYYILLPLIYFISLLPLQVLYLVSDLLFPLTYHLVGYRKKVVTENLRRSFPEKSRAELRTIARKFYRHFNDIMLETLKMISISPEKLNRRIRYTNPDILSDFYSRGKSVIMVTAHYNNWEWVNALSSDSPFHPVVIYKPLNNKYFDRLMKRMRERHGPELIPMRDTLRRLLRYKHKNLLTISGFLGDQSPVWEETQYWTQFLNQLTPVYLGAEKMALKTGHAVVFFHVKKEKRGYYEVEIIPLFEEVGDIGMYEITEKHVRVLERIIREKPEHWLWSHRRWKLTPRKMSEMNPSS